MIPLPPGCTVNHAITIDVNRLTEDMVEWYDMIGGTVVTREYYDSRSRKITQNFVKYGNAKLCHLRQDGSGGARLHFHGNDASVASMFLIKFMDNVEQHNMKEYALYD